MKKRVFTSLLGLSLLLMAGCAAKSSETTETTQAAQAAGKKETYKIGVLQLVQHDALDLANKGFFAALDDAGISYEADQQNAGGEQSSAVLIAEKFANDKPDLIFAIATPGAQAAAAANTEIPIIITAVTDPAVSGLVESNEKPGNNVTGTSDLNPVKEQIDLLKKLVPEAKKIAILYSSAESNSKLQADLAHEYAKEIGLEYEDYTISSSNELQSVTESMIGKVDAIYVPTDNMVSAGISAVAMVANENKLPIICGEEGMLPGGALATYGVDYFELGYLSGKQAIRILTEGAKPSEMPIEYLDAKQLEVAVNEEVAELLGIDVSLIK